MIFESSIFLQKANARSFPDGKQHVRKAVRLARRSQVCISTWSCLKPLVGVSSASASRFRILAVGQRQGRSSSRNREKIRRGRTIEEKEGTWKEMNILLFYYKYQCKLRVCLDLFKYLIIFYRVSHIYFIYFLSPFPLSALLLHDNCLTLNC